MADSDALLTFTVATVWRELREMARLRLAQARDLRGERELALHGYRIVVNETAIPEIRRQAELGLSAPFRLPDPRRNLLIREYNLEMAKYRSALPTP